MVTEKITKDGKTYHVWKVSENAGFYLAQDIDLESEGAQELIEDMIALCGELSARAEEALETIFDDAEKDGAATDVFDELQRAANESLALKNGTRRLDEKLPYLVRRSTGEKIVINRNIFKLGKDATYVDYFVDNNPTISRNHADIMHKKDGYYAKDKGSLNHTFIDGKKLEPEKSVKLESGSLLQLSNEVFEFIEQEFDDCMEDKTDK